MRRIKSVEIFRLLAIIAVISLHTKPFGAGNIFKGEVYTVLHVLIINSARFAVPFFFVISGYFFGKKVENGPSIYEISLNRAKRIAFLFFAWSIFYLVPFYDIPVIYKYGYLGPIKIVYWNILILLQHPFLLMMHGTKLHLWFLMALLCSLLITSFFVAFRRNGILILVAISLYCVCLLGRFYSNTPMGIILNFDTRLGPFAGTIFFVTGYFLSRRKHKILCFLNGIYIFLFGLCMHFFEIYFLWKLYNSSLLDADFTIGTYFMGVGSAIVALKGEKFFAGFPIGNLGRSTLGLYAVHWAFVDLLRNVGEVFQSSLWELGYIALVFVFSLIAVKLLELNKFTNMLVR